MNTRYAERQQVDPAMTKLPPRSLVIVTRDDRTETKTFTVGEPWQLGHGGWVVRLNGFAGAYDLARVRLDSAENAPAAEAQPERPAAAMHKWVVEFGVAGVWVADGFDLTPAHAKEAIERMLPHARENETRARVIVAPAPIDIARRQGFTSVAEMKAANEASLDRGGRPKGYIANPLAVLGGPGALAPDAGETVGDAAADVLEAARPIARWLGELLDRGEQVGNLNMDLVAKLRAAIAKAPAPAPTETELMNAMCETDR